jgi:hypothetical protein
MNRQLTLAVTALLVTVTLGTDVALAAGRPIGRNVYGLGAGQSQVTNSSAVLNGPINPNGSATWYWFQYGLTNPLGVSSGPSFYAFGLTSRPQSAGNGTKFVRVKAKVSGLLPGTRYHFVLCARNKYGADCPGLGTFKTVGPPGAKVATGPVALPGSSSATFTGVIYAHATSTNIFFLTNYYFQYGPTNAYGSLTSVGTIGAGGNPVTVASAVIGLPSGSTFHYRLVAGYGSNVFNYGNDQTFMTLPVPRPAPKVSASTNPQRPKTSQHKFTTSGHVNGPAATKSLACTGAVSIRFYDGGHKVAYSLAPLQPNCTFSTQTTVIPPPGSGSSHVKLKIVIHFQGNGYLAPTDARTEFVKLGTG